MHMHACQVLSASTNAVSREIVEIAAARERAAAADAKPGAKSAAFASVSRRFVEDINALVAALHETTAHFVRCMKPNPRFAALDFDHEMIMAQVCMHVHVHGDHGAGMHVHVHVHGDNGACVCMHVHACACMCMHVHACAW